MVLGHHKLMELLFFLQNFSNKLRKRPKLLANNKEMP